MKILIIDDTEALAETLKLNIELAIPGAEVSFQKLFDKALDDVATIAPDAIVLDIIRGSPGGAETDRPGDTLKHTLWDRHFCPLIIYSASPDIEDDAFATIHPLVKTCIKKGDAASDALVIGHLKEFIPIVAILLKVRGEAVRAMGDSLRDVYSVIKADTTDVGAQADLIGRIARRRVAASMDASASSLTPLRPWEQYVFPPIGDELLTGDVLFLQGSDGANPENYRVVLSPSCDLVVRSGCLQKILVASCGPVSTFLKAAAVGDATTGVEKLKKSLPKHLTADQVSGYFCLPALPESLPMMVVDLKSLDLVSRSDIGKGGEHRYHRVTSVDSPFRERIAWAYIQVAGRPGVPDLDAMKMAETLIDIVKSPTPGTHAQSN